MKQFRAHILFEAQRGTAADARVHPDQAQGIRRPFNQSLGINQ